MYVVGNLKYKNKNKLIDKDELREITGFSVPSRSKKFHVCNQSIKNIIIVNKKFAYPFVIKKVNSIYNKLISILTELLVSDDDSGETFREALNQIERFRMEIKNKYRKYLKQKELEVMSKQLSTLQKEAKRRLIDIENSYLISMKNNKGK